MTAENGKSNGVRQSETADGNREIQDVITKASTNFRNDKKVPDDIAKKDYRKVNKFYILIIVVEYLYSILKALIL